MGVSLWADPSYFEGAMRCVCVCDGEGFAREEGSFRRGGGGVCGSGGGGGGVGKIRRGEGGEEFEGC